MTRRSGRALSVSVTVTAAAASLALAAGGLSGCGAGSAGPASAAARPPGLARAAASKTGLSVDEALSLIAARRVSFDNMLDAKAELAGLLRGVELKGGYAPRMADATKLLALMRDDARALDMRPLATRPLATRPLDERLAAASYLLDLGSEEARRFVTERLEGGDPVAVANALAAVRLHLERRRSAWGAGALVVSVERLLPRVAERDVDWYCVENELADVAAALGRLKHTEAVPALVRYVERMPSSAACVRALGAIGDARAVPAVMATARDARGELRAPHVDALGALEVHEAVPLLSARLAEATAGERNAGVEKACIRALGAIRGSRAADAIKRYLAGGPTPELEAVARVALARLEETDPGAAVLRLLEAEGEAEAVLVYVGALGAAKEARAAGPLLRLARTSPEGAVRGWSILVLGEVATREAVEGLVALFDEPFKGISPWRKGGGPEMFREAVAEALRKATGMRFGADAEAWKTWLRVSGGGAP